MHEAVPMSQTPIQQTKNKLAKIYGVGVLVFTAIVGFFTLFASFLAHVKLT